MQIWLSVAGVTYASGLFIGTVLISKGIKGDRGFAGKPGIHGATGRPGFDGFPGPIGDQGPPVTFRFLHFSKLFFFKNVLKLLPSFISRAI